MKTNSVHISARAYLSVFMVLLGMTTASAQQKNQPIYFRNGQFTGIRNINHLTEKRDSLSSALYKARYYVLLQFDRIPAPAERKELEATGVQLFDYIPGRAYLAILPADLQADKLQSYGVSGVYHLPARLKIDRRLTEQAADHANSPDQLIAVSFFGDMTREEAGKALEEAGATLVQTKARPSHALFIRAGGKTLEHIAALPFVSFIRLQSIKDQSLNYNNRAAHGLDALNNDPARGLQGDGVTVGVGDDSDPYTHVDFTGRQIDRFAAVIGSHGTHTSGTVAGGGILDPRYKGMAPHATLISQFYSDVLFNAPAYVSDFDMVLTNNSYTAYNPGCINDGEYDIYSIYCDEQLTQYPNLLHVFAAGNDGGYNCTPYTAPFYTIKSGYQTAKNVLTVGNFDNYNYIISGGSSCGPVSDGRLKPEIVAGGTNIISTWPYNNYVYNTGTSMASPTVTGSLALLEQRYRQLNSGADAPAALLKALLCNNATDLGNPGPDFTYGFGVLDARTAVESLEAHRYFTGSLQNGNNAVFTIPSIPAGLQQIKIMLYWPDLPGSSPAASSLVNDLDLTVTTPDGTLHYPMVLNPAAGHVNDPAIEGADHINNIEQVVINNPAGGNFNISVKGSNIPSGSQPFMVTWQPVQPSVVLQYPYGGETWVPGETETIRWNAYGANTNPFTIDYSSDGGASWNTITSSVPASSRLYSWTVPATATTHGLIRMTRNGSGYSDISHFAFSILGQPSITASNPCQGYVNLVWNKIPSASSYDIMRLKGDSMVVISSTTDTNYLAGGLSGDSSYWLSVRPVNNGVPGRRSIAVNSIPSGGACALSALNNDLTVDSLIAPLSGRQHTSSALSSSTPVTVHLRNLGTISTAAPISLSYSVNGGAITTETSAVPLTAGAGTTYTFSQPVDFSAAGTYALQVWVSYPGDPQSANDTVTATIKQLSNDTIGLNPTFIEGFESAAAASYTSATKGFTGLDRCDFSRSNGNGRARTFLDSGFARTGSRSAILDQIHYGTATTVDSLITTFNLSNYSATDRIMLNFYYRNQGIDSSFGGNRVWIRGNDQAAWVPIYTLDTNFVNFGIYLPSPNIDISAALKAASQSVSSSFQIKFGEEGHTSSNNSLVLDGDLDDGYSFDDITFTRAMNDIGVVSLHAPVVAGVCSLSAAEAVTLTVRNYSSQTASNIPVSYAINGASVTESISSLAAGDSIVYTFAKKADLSAFQTYTLQAWVSYPTDSYPINDSLTPLVFTTTPLINSFPYLEGFESVNGNWYTGGIRSSWQWGQPQKNIINRAANGNKCWVTSLTGNYNDQELSYLYSPCFDLSSLTNPMLSFSHIFQTEDDCACDYHWAEYSNDGVNWIKLGTTGQGTNWYDDPNTVSWQQSDTIWHVSSIPIPSHGTQVRLRFVMSSDQSTNYEGVGVDDIHIYDKAAIYTGASIPSGLTKSVGGSGWVDFVANGQRIASINPNGQNLGATSLKVYIDPGKVRNDGKQYYLNRNLVIEPANAPTGPVSVRYYFMDAEADSLIHAAGCASCTSIHDAYQSGITQYSTPLAAEEDDDLSNNSFGTYQFHLPHSAVSIIPYDSGYYAEYAVNGFSEFWINNGGASGAQPLALNPLSFTVVKSGDNAILQWSLAGNSAIARFVTEKSDDSVHFTAFDSVAAIAGDTLNTYQVTDTRLWKGYNYYRLKVIDTAQHFTYTGIHSVYAADGQAQIKIYPNPTINKTLYISSSLPCRDIQLLDVSGREVFHTTGNSTYLTLSLGRLSKGIYIIMVDTDAGRTLEKVFVR